MDQVSWRVRMVFLLVCCSIMASPYVVLAQTTTDQDVADYLGMSAREVQSLREHEKLDEPQMLIAAVIAKKSHHPLSRVVAKHKQYHNWEQVSLYYQLEPNKLWDEVKRYFPQIIWYPRAFLQQPKLLSHVLSIYLHEDQQKMLAIIKQEDFASVMAAILAKVSGQKIEQILLLKKQMSWEEIKKQLQIKPDRIILEQERLKQILYQELER